MSEKFAREIAKLYDVPPWLVRSDIPRTRREVWRYRTRRIRPGRIWLRLKRWRTRR